MANIKLYTKEDDEKLKPNLSPPVTLEPTHKSKINLK